MYRLLIFLDPSVIKSLWIPYDDAFHGWRLDVAQFRAYSLKYYDYTKSKQQEVGTWVYEAMNL